MVCGVQVALWEPNLAFGDDMAKEPGGIFCQVDGHSMSGEFAFFGKLRIARSWREPKGEGIRVNTIVLRVA